MPQLTIPRGWNQRVQSAILQAISLGRHCFFLVVGRMARSPQALDRAVAETERLRHEVESLRAPSSWTESARVHCESLSPLYVEGDSWELTSQNPMDRIHLCLMVSSRFCRAAEASG